MDVQDLWRRVSTVCPIVGISIGSPTDKATWRLDYAPNATDAQKAAAQGVITNYNLNAPTKSSFLARDLLAQLTPADTAAIQKATTQSDDLRLLWWSLLGQGEAPISLGSDRFQKGWSGLAQAIGATRAAQVAQALGISP